MARDGLFFRSAGELNGAKVPAWGLVLQGVWAAVLVLPRTYNPATRHVRQPVRQPARLRDLGGADLLHPDDRRRVPAARDPTGRERPYRAFGYPVVPALYIAGAAAILLVLFAYRTATTWPGLVIVLLGVPVYFAWRSKADRLAPTALADWRALSITSQYLCRWVVVGDGVWFDPPRVARVGATDQSRLPTAVHR